MANEEWLKQKIKNRDDMIKYLRGVIERTRKQSSLWHGKWAIACQENNALRKKIVKIKSEGETE